MDATGGILTLITAGLNTATTVIKAQAQQLQNLFTVDNNRINYSAGIDQSTAQLALSRQRQQTVFIAVFIITVVLLIIFLRKK